MKINERIVCWEDCSSLKDYYSDGNLVIVKGVGKGLSFYGS